MGFYRRILFPRLMHAGLSSAAVTGYRASTLRGVTGEVLEIGFGTGLNLAHYPEAVRKVTAVDPNPGMQAVAAKNLAASPIAVDLRVEDARRLPFADASFDSVVCTWTLCSIPEAEEALREVYRVLKPGGRFFFVEHGLSPEPGVRAWQRRLTPLQRRVADGCRLDKDMRALVASLPWRLERLEAFYAEGLPRSAGYFYQGVAVK